MPTQTRPNERGPFRVEHLREGDRYELSNGHAIYCAPAGREHAGRNTTGAAVLDSDPAVDWAGVDAGFTPEPGTMRAPDVAVAPAGSETGFIPGAPPLAVEYAGPGQDFAELREKIAELLAYGTRQVWVVHLTGPRRVEVHTPDAPVRVLGPGDELTAPGVLRNPVPVAALYDREAGHRVMLRNLLQRAGYQDLDAVRAEGVAKGLEQGREQGREQGLEQARRAQTLTLLQRQLGRRFGALPTDIDQRLTALTLAQLEALAEVILDVDDLGALRAWLDGAAVAVDGRP